MDDVKKVRLRLPSTGPPVWIGSTKVVFEGKTATGVKFDDGPIVRHGGK